MLYDSMPTPVFFLFTLVLGGFLLYYTRIWWKSEPRLMSIGALFMGVAAIMAGTHRICKALIPQSDLAIILYWATMIIGIPGILVLMIGAFQRTQYDPDRRTLLLKVWGITVAVGLFLILLIWLFL
jgi:hypothetical protein